MQILETLIEYSASSLDRPFTYLCPDDTPVCAGMRVEVNFGAMPRPPTSPAQRSETMSMERIRLQRSFR